MSLSKVDYQITVCGHVGTTKGPTMIHRYKGGEDVRVGDVFDYFGDKICVREFTAEHGACVISNGAGSYYAPAACTLVRREGESESNYGERPLRCCTNCRCSIPPNVPTFARENGSWCRQCHENNCSALVDEKTEQAKQRDPRCGCPCSFGGGYIITTHTRNCPHVAEQTGTETATVIESFLRALAQPTTAERFEAFKARTLPLLRRFPLVPYDFDCDMENGMVLKLRRPECVPYKGDEWWAFRPDGLSEEAFDGLVIDRLHEFARDIGREVLLGRAVLRGGKR